MEISKRQAYRKEYLEKRSGERNVDRQQDTSTDGGRWRRQHKTELDGETSGL